MSPLPNPSPLRGRGEPNSVTALITGIGYIGASLTERVGETFEVFEVLLRRAQNDSRIAHRCPELMNGLRELV